MSNTMEKYSVITNANLSNYTVRVTTHQEKKTLIVPVVMIVEGVLNGSHGPLLHLAEDFGKIPESWNGIPVVINHPQQDGQSVSANSPDVIDSGLIGRIYNAHMDTNRLLAEVWLDEEKLSNISADTLVAVNSLQPIEVSVGVFTEDESIVGEYNGIQYNAIARNHRPDHLALLPGGVGACSLDNGCGIRANKKQTNQKGGKSVDRLEAIQVLKDSGRFIHDVGANMAQGLKEKLDELYELVRSKGDGKSTYAYLEEAYDTYLIYTVDSSKGQNSFKQNYQFNVTSGEPEFVGDSIEVEKKVEYKPIKEVNTNLKIVEMEKCTPCVEKKVTALVANKLTKFTEADREWLQNLEEAQLDQMVPEEPEEVAEVVENAVQGLSAEDQAALDFGKKMLKKKKEDMAKGIQKNTESGTWTDPELATMSEEMLEKLYKSVVKEEAPVANYSAQGQFRQPNVNACKEEALIPNVY